MSIIGSGVAGSIAAAPMGSQSVARHKQAEQADEAARARSMQKLADVQQHEVENTEQAELETILPDERRQRRRRRPDGAEEQAEAPADQVDLLSTQAPPAAKPSEAAAPPADRPAAAEPAAPQSGWLLDVEA